MVNFLNIGIIKQLVYNGNSKLTIINEIKLDEQFTAVAAGQIYPATFSFSCIQLYSATFSYIQLYFQLYSASQLFSAIYIQLYSAVFSYI